MASVEAYARRPRAERLARLARTADDLAAAIAGRSDVELSRRPDASTSSAGPSTAGRDPRRRVA